MSMYQGMCGGACQGGAGAPVLPKPESQLSSHMRTNLLGDALVYQHQVTTGKTQFKSATDYMRYKKARILSGTPLCVAGRPPQSAIITRLIETGCQACQPVCDIATTSINGGDVLGPLAELIDISDTEFSDFIFSLYGFPIPDAPDPYDYDSYIAVTYPLPCNSISYSMSILDSSGTPIPSQITNLGPNSEGFGVFIVYPSIDPLDPLLVDGSIVITASNSCSSSSGDAAILFCFLAGSPVALADGTTKPIEQVAVGDRVVGAFGEINTVTGTMTSALGFVSITNINGEHKTTAPHPHITTDYKLACTDPVSLSKFAYGKSFPITGADGIRGKRVIKGVNPDRIKKLEVGMSLQTLTGARTVSTLETIRMPPSTRVYHLTTDGSHSYTVDGYAVAGGATEEDWDYDTWTPRV